ncbi:VCBS repeat-containing protein [Streptomyces sp. PmtG]
MAFGAFGRGRGVDAALPGPRGIALRYDVPGAARATLEPRGATVAAGDVDGDGLSDLVTTGGGPGEVWLYRGRTRGLPANATATLTPATKGTPQVLKVADFDDDHRADVAIRTTTGRGTDRVEIYQGLKNGELITRRPPLTFSTTMFTKTT